MNEELSPLERAIIEKAIKDFDEAAPETLRSVLDSLNRFNKKDKLTLLQAIDLSNLEFILKAGIKFEDYEICEIVADLIAKKNK